MAFIDQPPSAPKKTGTGFTNLNRVLGANQSNQLGQVVGGGLNQQVGQAKTGIQSGFQNFQTEAQKNNVATDENKQKAQTLINDPTQANDQDVNAFASFRSGKYAGPNDLQNKSQLQNQAAQASTLGGMAGSAEGRQALLQRFVGGAGYNQGQQRLDSMLLGQTANQNQNLNAAFRDARNLNQQLGNASTAAQAQAKQIAGGNQQFATDTKTALNTNLGNIYDQGTQRVGDFNTSQQALLSGIHDAGKFTEGQNDINLSNDQYQALVGAGFDPNQYLYNANLGDFVAKSNFDATLNTAVTAEEAARAKALGRLTGTDVNQNAAALLGGINDESKYGTISSANKIDVDNNILKQKQEEAQEKLLRGYFNNVSRGLNPTARASSDEFIDNINKGNLNEWGVLGGRAPTNLETGQVAQDSLQLAGLPYLSQDEKNSYLNTGGDYSTKSNQERAIDLLRAGSAGATQVNNQYGVENGLTATGWAPLDGVTTPGMDAITGLGIDPYTKQFGRLRKVMAPSSPITRYDENGKPIVQGPIVG